MSLPAKDQEKHIIGVIECIATPEKGPPTQRRVHLLHYTATIATQAHLANLLVRDGLLNMLARQFKENNAMEM